MTSQTKYQFLANLNDWNVLVQYRPCYAGWAVRGDAAGEAINLGNTGDFNYTSGFTEEYEFLYLGPGFGVLPRIEGRAGYSFELGIGNGTAIPSDTLGIYWGGAWHNSGYVFTAGKNYSLTVRCNTSDKKIRIHVNGNQTPDYTSPPSASINVVGNKCLINRGSGYTEGMYGLMREHRAYSREITTLEVFEHYNHVYYDNTSLIEYFPMSEGGGTIVYGSLGVLNGTVVNADWLTLKVVGGGGVAARYYNRHFGDPAQAYDKFKGIIGSVAFTAKINTPASENYMELYKTFAQIASAGGVTLGSNQRVAYVQVDHLDRVEGRNWGGSGGNGRWMANFDEGEVAFGPVELRQQDGTLVSTLSDRVDCPGRDTGADPWIGYPQHPDWPFTPAWNTGYDELSGEAVEKHPSWRDDVGKRTLVPYSLRAKDTTVRIRIRNKLPLTANSKNCHVRLKDDRVLITLITEDRNLPITGVGL